MHSIFTGFLSSNKLTQEDWTILLLLVKAAVDFVPVLATSYRDTLFEHLYTDYIYFLNPVIPLVTTPVRLKRGKKLMLSSTLM